jgi:hypothetical protein
MRMKTWLLLAGLFVALGAGCNTYFTRTGQTLPSPRYLDHPPQFIPPSPPFPLANENRSLLKASGEQSPVLAPSPFPPSPPFAP